MRSARRISRISRTQCPTIRTRASSRVWRWPSRGCPEAEAAALADLRVYPRGVPIPDALVLRFWASHRQLGARAARDTLARLADRALLRWDGEPRTVQLHALEHDLLRARGPDAAPLHRAIVEMYRGDCPTDWAAGPNDGYFFEWFLHHLAASGDAAGCGAALVRSWVDAGKASCRRPPCRDRGLRRAISATIRRRSRRSARRSCTRRRRSCRRPITYPRCSPTACPTRSDRRPSNSPGACAAPCRVRASGCSAAASPGGRKG